MSNSPRAGGPSHVTIEAWQSRGRVFLDYFVNELTLPGTRPRVRQRRVVIDCVDPLDDVQLTRLAGSMVSYVLAGHGPRHAVPEGLLMYDYDNPPKAPVPPGGGEGGANTFGGESAVRPIPRQRRPPYNQNAPGRSRGQREARNRSSSLDLPAGWWEEPMDWSEIDLG